MNKTLDCPACGAATISHCDDTSHTCDWWKCRRCKSYGRDAERWVDGREKPAK